MRAETLRRLLLYLWQHRGDPISEYAIATDGLGRREDFDPRSDASVRVQVSRLRRKLKDYYEQKPDEPELLSIPTGSHQVTVAGMDPRSLTGEPEAEPEKPRPWFPAWLLPVSAAVCALLLAVMTGMLWRQARRESQAGAASRERVGEFWSSFIGKDRNVKILLPTPAFYSFSGARNIRLRSTDVNDFDELDKSPQFKAVASQLGSPSLEHSYTVTSDTLAAIDLARYLDAAGLSRQVSFAVTGDSNAQAMEHNDLIAFGAHTTLHPFRDDLATMNFSLSESSSTVVNAQPQPGEARQYDPQHISAVRSIQPSIIAVLPGRAPGFKLLIMESVYTSAMVSLLTSHTGGQAVEKILHEHHDPKFFEMVVLSEIEGDQVLRTWPVALHPYTHALP